jgi:Tol biopolymer transport system component
MCRRFLKQITQLPLIYFAVAQSVSAAVQLELVSKPYTNASISFGDSLGVQLSGDAKWALITSSAEGIPRENSAEPSLDIFLRNIATADTKSISRGRNGGGGSGPSIGLSLSVDGRFALFSSDADDLVEGDTNNATDIFLYDRVQDSLTLVSRKEGMIGDGDSTDATMTPDSRFVLFQSAATNLATNDVNELPDLFVWDRQNGLLRTVTEGLLGGQRRPKFDVSISSDGHYVAFLSTATNPPLGLLRAAIPPESDPQVYLRDMLSGALYWMTEQADHGPGRFASNVRLSTNGQIAFISSDLQTGPASIKPSTYVYWIRIDPRLIMRLPQPTDITGEYPRTVSEMVMTADGQQLAYILNYGLGFFGAPEYHRVYLFDVPTAQHRLLATSTNVFFKNLGMSDDGKVITLAQVSTNSEAYQLYRIDALTGAFQLLSRDESLREANSDVFDPVLTADGSMAAFVSDATNIGVSNPGADDNVFAVWTDGTQAAFQLSGAWPSSVSSTPSGNSRIPTDPFGPYVRPKPALSIDGSRVLFTSSAWNISPGDTNGHGDLFLRDLTTRETKRIEISSDDNLRTMGFSRNASIVAFADRRLVRSTYTYDLHAVDINSGRDLLDGIFPPTNEGFGPFLTTSALSDSGQFMLVELRGNATDRTFFLRDFLAGTNIPLPITRLQVSSASISPEGRYVILESTTRREAGLAGENLIIEVATGATNLSKGLFVGSSPDGANLLFRRSEALSRPGDLFLFSPSQSISNLLTTNASFPAMSFNGRVLVFNQQYSPTGGGDPRTRAFAMNGLNGVPFPLGVRADGKELRFDEAPSVSADGRYVAFAMSRDNGAADSDYLDVYLYDGCPNGPSRSPTVAANGRVVFESLASDLVPDDHNLDFDVFVATVSPPDTDQDGVDDGWEMQNFGTLFANGSDDLDGDRFTNYQESLAGTNPKNAESALRIGIGQGNEADVLRWDGTIGRRYQVQVRQSLAAGGWQDVGLPVTALSTNLSARVQRDTESNVFYRIRLVE